MRRFLFFLTLLITLNSLAQQVFWAHEIAEYSSQRGDKEFSASQVLGEPNAYPNGGESASSWCPKKESSGKDEFIKVKFEHPTQIQQIIIAENFNPGAISKVIIVNTGGYETVVYNETPSPIDKQSRLLTILLPQKTSYKIRQVHVYLSTKSVPGYNCLDAIGISESNIPVTIDIPLAENAVFEHQPENLGSAVNSVAHDFIPQISPDGLTLYYTRREHPENFGEFKLDDVWYSSNVNNKWEAAVKMPAPINNDDANFVYNITPDGNTLLLGNSYGEYGAQLGISVSAREKNGWTTPTEWTIEELHSLSEHNEFFLGANKKILIMTLERPEGLGGTDIYVSFLKSDNTWQTPKNIGNIVNTASNEVGPFLAADNKTLYFASSGHRGYGNLDVFVSTRLDDSWQNWSAPMNLGNIINTSEAESYYSVPASGEYAYFVSKNNTFGKSDIFRVKLPESIKPQPVALIYGNVYNSETNKPMAADIFYEIMPQGVKAGFASSDPETGSYKIVLPLGEEYGFYAEKYGFLSVNDNLNLKEVNNEYVEIKRDLYLAPLKKGQKIVVNSLLFYRSEENMLPSALPELNRIIETMKTKQSMIVKLHGHTDNRGSYEANLELSKKRVEIVKKHMVDNGILPDRILVEGHGHLQPLVENDSEEHRRRNRRVEFEVITF